MTKLFNDKGFWKTMIRLTVPVALQNLLTSSFALVDTLFVSSLGTVSLSAVGMGGQWSWLMFMVLVGFCSACSLFTSQYWGVKDIEKIRRTSGMSILFSLLVSLIFTVFAFFTPSLVMKLFNSDANVLSVGTQYLRIAAFSYIPIALTNILSAALRATEEVKLPMYASLSTTVLNIFLDYSLIFGKFGFPKMGIRGAAIATVIAAWLGLVVIVFVSVIKKNILVAKMSEFFTFSKNELNTYLKKATPVVINESMWGLGTFVYNIIFGHMGYEYFSSLTIVRSFENVAFVIFIGIASSAAVMVGKSVGKGNIERCIEDSKKFLIIVPLLAIAMSALIIVFRNQLVSVFNMGNNISELTVITASLMMVIYSVFFPLRMLTYLEIVSIFRAGGETVTGAKYELICLWALSVPATLIAVYVLNVPFLVAYAVMLAFEDIPKVTLTLKFYFSKKWLKPVTKEGRQGLKEYMKSNHI